MTIVCPITHSLKKLKQKTHLVIAGEKYNLKYPNSMILTEQIITIDKSKINCIYGQLTDDDISKLNEALKISLEL